MEYDEASNSERRAVVARGKDGEKIWIWSDTGEPCRPFGEPPHKQPHSEVRADPDKSYVNQRGAEKDQKNCRYGYVLPDKCPCGYYGNCDGVCT